MFIGSEIEKDQIDVPTYVDMYTFSTSIGLFSCSPSFGTLCLYNKTCVALVNL